MLPLRTCLCDMDISPVASLLSRRPSSLFGLDDVLIEWRSPGVVVPACAMARERAAVPFAARARRSPGCRYTVSTHELLSRLPSPQNRMLFS